ELNLTWRTTLAELGLGRFEPCNSRLVSEFLPSLIAESRLIECPPGQFQDLVTGQLNQPFHNTELPFRPFFCRENEGLLIGSAYRHWVCDSYCIRLILREWLFRLICPQRARRQPTLLARKGYWHHFGPGPADWPLFSTLMQQVSHSARMKSCRRVTTLSLDHTVCFREYRAETGLIDAIRASARRRNVKVNDLFLAALARTVDELAPIDRKPIRPNLALGTVVDLRGLRGKALGDQFGVFLGFTSTIVRPSVLRDDDRLLASIAAQSALARDRGLAQASQVRMALALLYERTLHGQKLEGFYRKRFPLAGGISNVTLHNTWAAELHPTILREYVRASPCGPLVPLVVTPTTLGSGLHLGVTTRSALMNPAQAEQIGPRFLRELGRLV
ncbi:MAG: hypothetical protein NZ561_11890, partial [Phycisphaerae bacterium]|nr:hypothetical protein [Phycisphaerae bacterium]MDW8262419.1 hypothetical protein [Phycisphaerales bacterium]